MTVPFKAELHPRRRPGAKGGGQFVKKLAREFRAGDVYVDQGSWLHPEGKAYRVKRVQVVHPSPEERARGASGPSVRLHFHEGGSLTSRPDEEHTAMGDQWRAAHLARQHFEQHYPDGIGSPEGKAAPPTGPVIPEPAKGEAGQPHLFQTWPYVDAAHGGGGKKSPPPMDPLLAQAFHDKVGGHAYLGTDGAYHLTNNGKPGGPVAPWNDKVKELFGKDQLAFLKAANDFVRPVPFAGGKKSPPSAHLDVPVPTQDWNAPRSKQDEEMLRLHKQGLPNGENLEPGGRNDTPRELILRAERDRDKARETLGRMQAKPFRSPMERFEKEKQVKDFSGYVQQHEDTVRLLRAKHGVPPGVDLAAGKRSGPDRYKEHVEGQLAVAGERVAAFRKMTDAQLLAEKQRWESHQVPNRFLDQVLKERGLQHGKGSPWAGSPVMPHELKSGDHFVDTAGQPWRVQSAAAGGSKVRLKLQKLRGGKYETGGSHTFSREDQGFARYTGEAGKGSPFGGKRSLPTGDQEAAFARMKSTAEALGLPWDDEAMRKQMGLPPKQIGAEPAADVEKQAGVVKSKPKPVHTTPTTTTAPKLKPIADEHAAAMERQFGSSSLPGGYHFTGEETPSHMASGTVYKGHDEKLYQHMGEAWKGATKGYTALDLASGKKKFVPYFATHGHTYPIVGAQPEPHEPVHAHDVEDPLKALHVKKGIYTPSSEQVAGVHMSSAQEVGSLTGKNIVVTGKLQTGTRTEIHGKIAMSGGKPQPQITHNTHLLVVGDKPGSKLAKASAMGIPVITEHELQKLMEARLSPQRARLAQRVGELLEAKDEWQLLEESTLSTEERKALPRSAFAIPEKAPGAGSYPIHDIGHARNALARAAGKPVAGRVRAAVAKRYPELASRLHEGDWDDPAAIDAAYLAVAGTTLEETWSAKARAAALAARRMHRHPKKLSPYENAMAERKARASAPDDVKEFAERVMYATPKSLKPDEAALMERHSKDRSGSTVHHYLHSGANGRSDWLGGPGSETVLDRPLSTTGKATGWTGDVHYEIHIKKGKTFRPRDFHDAFASEDEHLLAPGNRLKVVSRTTKAGKTHVVAEMRSGGGKKVKLRSPIVREAGSR